MRKNLMLLMVMICALLLVGCGGFEKIERNVVDPNTDVSQKIDLAIKLPYVEDETAMKANPVIALMEELTGYKCDYSQFPSGSGADSELTGYFTKKGTEYHAIKLTKNQFNNRAISAAAYADLTEIINSPKYSVLKNAISEEAWAAVTYDGKILGIPDSASNNNIDKAILIRKDIMYTLVNPDTGKNYDSVPTTYEGFVKLLKAFKEATGSTTALTLPSNIEIVPAIAASFGLEGMWQDINGELVYAAENPALGDYLSAMNTLFNEGLLDKNMTTNSFNTCANKFANGTSIATVGSFWELATIDYILQGNGDKKYEDCVDFAVAFENKNGEMRTWQSSGCTYVTVIPNWMADTGAYVIDYIQEKIKDENFIQIVAGQKDVHYEYDEIKEEYSPLTGFSEAKKNASYFVTGTNDKVYNTFWTQVVVKGTPATYFQWKKTNVDAIKRGVKGILDPTGFVPALKEYSSRAAGIENDFKDGAMRVILGSGNETVETIKATFNASKNQNAINEIKDWYKNR